MKRWAEILQREARNRASSQGVVFYCCSILLLIFICISRGTPEFPGFKHDNGIGSGGESDARSGQAVILVDDTSLGVVGSALSGPEHRLFFFDAAVPFLAAATAFLQNDKRAEDGSDEDVMNFGDWSGIGVSLVVSTADTDVGGSAEFLGSGSDPELNSILPINYRSGTPPAVPEPDPVKLFVVGGLITGWWKMRHRAVGFRL